MPPLRRDALVSDRCANDAPCWLAEVRPTVLAMTWGLAAERLGEDPCEDFVGGLKNTLASGDRFPLFRDLVLRRDGRTEGSRRAVRESRSSIPPPDCASQKDVGGGIKLLDGVTQENYLSMHLYQSKLTQPQVPGAAAESRRVPHLCPRRRRPRNARASAPPARCPRRAAAVHWARHCRGRLA